VGSEPRWRLIYHDAGLHIKSTTHTHTQTIQVCYRANYICYIPRSWITSVVKGSRLWWNWLFSMVQFIHVSSIYYHVIVRLGRYGM